MRFDDFTFGSICIDGVTYQHDVVIDRGQISKRKKELSKKFRGEFGHTPLSLEEKDRLVTVNLKWGLRHATIRIKDKSRYEYESTMN